MRAFSRKLPSLWTPPLLTLIRRVDEFLRSRMKTSRWPFVSARSLSKFVDVEMNATKRPSELTLELNEPLRTVPSPPDEVMLTRSTVEACADAASAATTIATVTANRVHIRSQSSRSSWSGAFYPAELRGRVFGTRASGGSGQPSAAGPGSSPTSPMKASAFQ